MENGNVEINNKKMTIILIGSTVVLVLISVLLTTFAFFNYTRTGDPNVIKTGKLDLSFNEGVNSLNLTNQFPVPDNEAYNTVTNGSEVTITDFTVTGYSTMSPSLAYTVYAIKGTDESGKNRFPDEHVKLYLVGETNGHGTLNIENGYDTADATAGTYGALASVGNSGTDTANNGNILLATGTVGEENTEHSYTLRMWIDDDIKISDTDSSYTYCASALECNDTRKVYSTMYYSLKLKVESNS